MATSRYCALLIRGLFSPDTGYNSINRDNIPGVCVALRHLPHRVVATESVYELITGDDIQADRKSTRLKHFGVLVPLFCLFFFLAIFWRRFSKIEFYNVYEITERVLTFIIFPIITIFQ